MGLHCHARRCHKTLITSLGGLKAIAISHPHYYTTMQDWAAEFNAPIYLHASDRGWVMRDSPWIRFWDGDTIELTRDVTMIRLGGHFAGGCVLHWARDEGVVLSGDIVQVTRCPCSLIYVELPQYATVASRHRQRHHPTPENSEI